MDAEAHAELIIRRTLEEVKREIADRAVAQYQRGIVTVAELGAKLLEIDYQVEKG